MKCPHCNTAYHSNLREKFIPENLRSKSDSRLRLFFEYCPECQGLILGTYEYNKNDFMNSIGIPADLEQKIRFLKYGS